MLFHGEETIRTGVAGDTKIRAVTSDFPTPRGDLIPHVRDLYIQQDIVLTTTTSTEAYLLDGYLSTAFSQINIKMTDGSMLYKTTNGRMLRVIKELYFGTMDDWDIVTTAANTYSIKFPIPFNFEKSFDRPDYTYLYPADEFAEVDIPFATATGATNVGGCTVTTHTWKLIADIVWLNQRFRSPIRTWFNVAGSGDKVTLDAGKYQYAIIENDKAANANLYDGGLIATGPNYELKGEDGRLLQQQWFYDLMLRGDTGVLVDNRHDDGSALAIVDQCQPVIWGKRSSLLPVDGILGPLSIKHTAADPDVADIFVLQTFG